VSGACADPVAWDGSEIVRLIAIQKTATTALRGMGHLQARFLELAASIP
jgi:hypothetical protein